MRSGARKPASHLGPEPRARRPLVHILPVTGTSRKDEGGVTKLGAPGEGGMVGNGGKLPLVMERRLMKPAEVDVRQPLKGGSAGGIHEKKGESLEDNGAEVIYTAQGGLIFSMYC